MQVGPRFRLGGALQGLGCGRLGPDRDEEGGNACSGLTSSKTTRGGWPSSPPWSHATICARRLVGGTLRNSSGGMQAAGR